MADRADFWNRIAKKYAASPIADEAAYHRKLALTSARLKPEMEVLEFGCGTGGTARHHAPKVRHYRATDISPAMIKIARGKGPVPDNLTFDVAEFDTIPLDDDSLDMVLGMSILHLVADPAVTIAKAVRVLKPGGFFVSSTACVGRMWYLRPLVPLGRAVGLLPQLTFFTENALRDMVRAAGLEIVEDWQAKKGAALFLIARKPG
jgi:ubiquinone/menaquinone biosynthesis C-methylase UbiE